MALSGNVGVKMNKRDNALIRFVGYRTKDADCVQAVPESQLCPFGDFDATTSSNEMDNADEEPQWNPDRLQQYLNSIRNQKEFSASNNKGTLNIRAERIFLELFLERPVTHTLDVI